MHKKSVINIIGLIIILLGFSMLFSAIVAVIYKEGDLIPILKSSVITLLFGIFLYLPTRRIPSEIAVRDGFAIVTFGWIFMAIFSALPFWISGAIPSYRKSASSRD